MSKLSHDTCDRCDAMEPHDYDFSKHGLWACDCKKVKVNIDDALKELEKRFNHYD